mmetsp:Transcript_8689/g.36402  ORF Transcript_8689/g.36402 Transcript_8689/m.36402 type:complete len:319 (+) Transcript_8689:374-1330(+)
MRHRAARGRARRFPRRGVARAERGEQGHASGWRARAFRVQSAGHAVQRAARGLGVRGRDASRALGRARRRPPACGVSRGGRGDHEGRRRVHRRGARAPRRTGRAARAPPPASARAQVREERQERRGGWEENGTRVQQLRMHFARDAAHAPRAERRALAVQRVRPVVRAARDHAAGGGWAGEPGRARAAERRQWRRRRRRRRGDGERAGARRRVKKSPRRRGPRPAAARGGRTGPPRAALGRRPVLRGGPQLALAVGGRQARGLGGGGAAVRQRRRRRRRRRRQIRERRRRGGEVVPRVGGRPEERGASFASFFQGTGP